MSVPDTSRNLVLCLDGTRNEPETGPTNVARVYDIAIKDDRQLVYYDPGVGTMGARSATTRLGKALTRAAGTVIGYGVRENIEEAYRFLMTSYRPGDRIYVFGFSRGAYTARALVGMLRTVGLLRAGADNLVPYALKLYTKSGKPGRDDAEETEYWRLRAEFTARFGNPSFPNRFSRQVSFLGVWDTVKTVGWLNWRAQVEQARWPFTRKIPNVTRAVHALAVDERRRPYPEYRFDGEQVARDPLRFKEVWFAGAHSDVGGAFRDDHKLSDIALQWVVDEAVTAGLRIDPRAYKKHVSVAPGEPLPPDHVMGRIHHNGIGWALLGGWHERVIGHSDTVHDSVHQRVRSTAHTESPYRPKLPPRQGDEP